MRQFPCSTYFGQEQSFLHNAPRREPLFSALEFRWKGRLRLPSNQHLYNFFATLKPTFSSRIRNYVDSLSFFLKGKQELGSFFPVSFSILGPILVVNDSTSRAIDVLRYHYHLNSCRCNAMVTHANVFWCALRVPSGSRVRGPRNDVAFIKPDDLKNLKDPPFFGSLAL